MKAMITVDFVVPLGYAPGDYAILHTSGGSGDIDWNSPASSARHELFPQGAGVYGFGHAPFGHHRFGCCHSMRTPGFGRLPFGRNPFGHGTSVVRVNYKVSTCGYYRLGLACYDAVGNLHDGDPGEAAVNVHVPPPSPAGLTKNSYNKATGVLTLDAAV